MTPRKPSAHSQLDELNQRLAAARLAERQAEVALAAANTAVETARDKTREAADLNVDTAKPMQQLDAAKREAERAQLGYEGMGLRVQRADADRGRFIEEHGERLLAELEPQCQQVAADLRAHAEALLATHQRWNDLSRTVSAYLRGLNINAAQNAHGTHQLEPVVRDLRRVLTGDIDSPAPHFVARDNQRATQPQRKAA